MDHNKDKNVCKSFYVDASKIESAENWYQACGEFLYATIPDDGTSVSPVERIEWVDDKESNPNTIAFID